MKPELAAPSTLENDDPGAFDSPDENPSKIVWNLAWPAVALNSLQVVNSLLDRGFIGHLAAAALTGHGASLNVVFLTVSLSMTLATSATALVSRAYGAERHEEVQVASRKSLSVSIIAGVVLAVLTAAAAPAASRALLPPGDLESIGQATRFLTVFAIGLPAFFVIQSLAGSLRGVGDTKSPMVISGMQILLHMTLNFLFIFPPRAMASGFVIPGLGLGLVGAAAALATSAWLAALAYMAHVRSTPLGDAWRFTVPEKEWVVRILRIALPAATMAVLRVGSLTAFTLVLKGVPNGSTAIAAMSIGFAIESIMFMPAFGLSVSASALVGQSLGMRKPRRAERLGWTASHHAALVIGILVVPLFFLAPGIAHVIVGGKEAMASEASLLIRTLCVTEVFFGYAMVLIGAMQGAGDTKSPMWITIWALWGLRVPLAYVLAIPLGIGSFGAWLAMSISQAVQGLLAMAAFKKGAWKTKEV
ncbi:MAG: MATE family efflux transporter [Fimbriimonadaceae bacterium]|nr:MATE family efflux transporter [Fimbriimonadaceae bacterium]